jgi:putative tributyrin esterase
MKKTRAFLLSIFVFAGMSSFAATVDSLNIPSAAMNKTYKAAVVLPASYAKNKSAYPVLYLLHGGGGHFRDWLTSTPDKMLVKSLADQYNIIVVMPEGETFSWYLNSKFDKGSQFESYITEDVISTIDKTYRTVANSKGRVITGLSMGGHGSLYLATRHPNLFCSAGSMSGGLDLNSSKWKIAPEFAKNVKDRFEVILGPDTTSSTLYADNSVVNLADEMKANNMPLVIDCGVDDFLLEPNRELHHRLVYNNTKHDYTERPGGHTWEYWENSLPYHVLYFYKVFKANGVTVQ